MKREDDTIEEEDLHQIHIEEEIENETTVLQQVDLENTGDETDQKRKLENEEDDQVQSHLETDIEEIEKHHENENLNMKKIRHLNKYLLQK